jgi:hypothetical protein
MNKQIESVPLGGSTIFFTDGTRGLVDPRDHAAALSWKRGDCVTLAPFFHSGFAGFMVSAAGMTARCTLVRGNTRILPEAPPAK